MTRPIPPRAMSERPSAQRGFTLIELMIAMIVSAIVVLGVFAFSSIQQTTAGMHERNVRIQQALEGAMWTMSQDVRHAGMGFARVCSELRVWDPGTGQLINPGAPADPANAYSDSVTGQSYWVLRDGIQAHWNSTGANDLAGASGSSATPDSASDSFDVVVADSSYVQSPGVFQLVASIDGSTTDLVVQTSSLLDNTNADHLAQVRQLFPPGTFVAVARTPGGEVMPMRPEVQGQCMLLQITGDVQPDGVDTTRWLVPVGNLSGFNANLGAMVADSNGAIATCPPANASCDDWDPGSSDNQVGASVLPLGRLRWSRYEIDYSVPNLPYLVRYDIIGFQQGVDPGNLGAVDYPHCNAGECPAPQLHLPGSQQTPPTAVAIGPMLEDMQVAVGCDGYTVAGADLPVVPLPPPDPGFEEVGPSGGPNPGTPNAIVDENDVGNGRDVDEWLGNAATENTAPDCVYYGSGDYNVALWENVEGASNPPPPFRMSPQTLRITLTATTETAEAAGGLATATLAPAEDRPSMASPVGLRQRFTLTERFTPKNLRWRDPSAT